MLTVISPSLNDPMLRPWFLYSFRNAPRAYSLMTPSDIFNFASKFLLSDFASAYSFKCWSISGVVGKEGNLPFASFVGSTFLADAKRFVLFSVALFSCFIQIGFVHGAVIARA